MRPASIQKLYDGIAAGRVRGFTVPAFNLRGLLFETARAIFRAAKKLDAGAFIFEISRGEMSYTGIRPAEFSTAVQRAAEQERWAGPVFLQGDHFQFDPAEYARDAAAETDRIKALTREAIDSGFFNIDIDASTLVDLSRPMIRDQQRDNFDRTAEMTEFIRAIKPDVSVGGEIGEVGKANSTVEEFEEFFEGYRERWNEKPISKMSVQTGTSHGGVILPDGPRAKVALDFSVLRDIGAACRRRGLAGTVQHGASTLPEEMFGEFPKNNCVEIHLATGFQQAIFNHPRFPEKLREKQVRWIEENRPPGWRADATPAQNFETCVKRTWGPMKNEFADLPRETLDAIMERLEEKFAATMTRLGVRATRGLVEEL
jgi:fructose/tagatose bisphosphate aldolase